MKKSIIAITIALLSAGALQCLPLKYRLKQLEKQVGMLTSNEIESWRKIEELDNQITELEEQAPINDSAPFSDEVTEIIQLKY